jgi:hypothetical protein
MSRSGQEDVPLIQTDSDFEEMNWHDCPIYAVFIDYRSADLLLDIDYICKWIPPQEYGRPFSFLIAPSTLVFHSAVKISMSFESSFMPLRISEILREDKAPVGPADLYDYRWTIQGPHGSIILRAVGYTQYRRQQPIHTSQQSLSLEQRHGISFVRGYGLGG